MSNFERFSVLLMILAMAAVFTVAVAALPAARPDPAPVVAFVRAGESTPFWTVACTTPVVGQHVAGPWGHGVVAEVGPNVGGVVRVTLEAP